MPEAAYKAARLFLIVSVLELGYAMAVAIACGWPWSMFVALGAIAVRTVKKRGSLWKMGTARWANEADLRRAGMIGSENGLMIGRIDSPKPSIFQVAPALFNRRVGSKAACSWFLRCMSSGKTGQLVRLSKSVHTAIFAPTGAGKDAGIIIPYLLDCPDSMVCIDIKGELALATAEHREKAFGHKIVILDPYKVITQ
jgi:type IV secretion system protein VirD4